MKDSLKILQLNIWGGRLGKQIIDLIKKENPDIVCLQETMQIEGGDGFLFEDIDEIKTEAGYLYSNFVPHMGFKLMKRHSKMGLAILSNFPFEKTSSIFTSLEYEDDFDLLYSDYNRRSLQHVVINRNGISVNILNHYGYHISGHKNGNDETMRQCKIIVDYIEKLKGSVVLCGDFNLVPDSQSLEQINKILVNHVKDKGVLTTRTSLTSKTEVCDYIFTSSDLKVKNFEVLDDVASDHRALVIVIK